MTSLLRAPEDAFDVNPFDVTAAGRHFSIRDRLIGNLATSIPNSARQNEEFQGKLLALRIAVDGRRSTRRSAV
jgi:hypothetical protein